MKLFFFTIYMSITFISFAQVDSVNILTGKNEKYITDYFDNLNGLKPNPYYKINKSNNENGDLELSVDFSIDDEDFYKCLKITATFQRVNGIEYCTAQLIFGHTKNANFYLSYIKDNFEQISNSVWESPSSEIIGLKNVTQFNKIDKNYFGLIFKLKENNK